MLNTTSPVATPPVGLGADGLALEDRAVGQDQERFADGAHRWASPSITTGSPAQDGVADLAA